MEGKNYVTFQSYVDSATDTDRKYIRCFKICNVLSDLGEGMKHLSSCKQTSLGMLSSFQCHVSRTRCHRQFSSVILCRFLNPDFNESFLFNQAFTEHCQHAASASEVTTVQRSRNSIIIIIISICVSHVNQPKHIYTMPQDIAEAKPMPLPGARLHSQCT